MFSYTTYKMFLCEIVLYGLSYMRLVREIKKLCTIIVTNTMTNIEQNISEEDQLTMGAFQ